MKTKHRLTTVLLILSCLAFTPVAAHAFGMATPSDKVFIRQAAFGGNDEIALSRVAVRRSNNPAVRMFAERMIVQHSAAGAKLKVIAASLGVHVPSALDRAHHLIRARLESLSGTAFNQAYINVMVKDHVGADQVFQMGATVDSDRLRSFAVSTLPVVEDHLKMARMLQRRMMMSTM